MLYLPNGRKDLHMHRGVPFKIQVMSVCMSPVPLYLCSQNKNETEKHLCVLEDSSVNIFIPTKPFP